MGWTRNPPERNNTEYLILDHSEDTASLQANSILEKERSSNYAVIVAQGATLEIQ